MDETSEGKPLPKEFIDKMIEQGKAGAPQPDPETATVMQKHHMDRIADLAKVQGGEIEVTEATLKPEELTHAIIETLKSEIYLPAVEVYKTFSSKIKGVKGMSDFAQYIEDASIDTNADLELMVELSELALKGQPIKVVSRMEATERGEEDRSFLYLGPQTNQPDIDPSGIRTIEKATPEQLNGLLLRTVENRTRHTIGPAQIYPEIALMNLPNHPEEATVNSFTTSVKKVSDVALELEKVGYNAMQGKPVKVTLNESGKQILALTPPKR